MPLFDYTCRSCGRVFEALVRAQDTAACPSCASTDLEKHLSSFAVNSSERSKAAALASRKKAAAAGTQERMALEREGEAHRKEEH